MSDRNQFWPGRRNRLPHLLRKTIDPARWAAVSPRSPKTVTHRGVLTAGFRMPPMATNRRTCRGKQGVSLNLKCPQGVELCLRMMEKVDVVIENFRPGTLARLGLGYDAARARNPRLIYCSISGYGQDGPSRDQSAMDLILQASCGLLSVTGAPDGQLARCGHSVADITAGMFALIGILIALRARDASGIGQFVDVSMLDSMIS